MVVKWQDFRQHGLLTIAIVAAVAALLDMVTPLDYRGGLVVVALVALVLGWRP
jgi:thiamine transporter ThiT